MLKPITDLKGYEAALNKIYRLLQKDITPDSIEYITLASYCILVNHYEASEDRIWSAKGIEIYNKIQELARSEEKQDMFAILGISFCICEERPAFEFVHAVSLVPNLVDEVMCN